jgi:hypothetical protein
MPCLTSDRVYHWRLLLEEYAPKIVYIKGIHNAVADAILQLEYDPKLNKSKENTHAMLGVEPAELSVQQWKSLAHHWRSYNETSTPTQAYWCGASLGGTLDYIPNPTLMLKKQRVFTFTSAFLRSTNVGIVCDPSIEFIINRP